MRHFVGLVLALALGVMGCSETSGTGGSSDIEFAASTAVASESSPELIGFRIGISNSANSEVEWLTTDGQFDDYKPVYSPDGSQIVFFRTSDCCGEVVPEMRTNITVMNADGTDVRSLTSGDHADVNPTWTRDGANEVTFTRLTQNPFTQKIYRTSPDAEPGDERLISLADPAYFEFGYSTLEDGRMLVRRDFPTLGYFLVTPNPGGAPTYEQISYEGADDTYLHKMTVSPGETKIAYMKVANITLPDILAQTTYRPAVIAYADFDPVNLTIENEVEITELDESGADWYPVWTPDENHVVYASTYDGVSVIRAYSLDTGMTAQISSRDDLTYRYPSVVGGVPK